MRFAEPRAEPVDQSGRGRPRPPPRRQDRSASHPAARRGARRGAPCRSRSRHPSRMRAPPAARRRAWRRCPATRSGAAVPTWARATSPSMRKNAASRSRAPSPFRSSAGASVRASEATVMSSESMSTTGSAKRRSAESLGAGRRGDSTSSRRPERLVEARDQADAEAGGERRAWLADQLADPLQAETVEQRLLLRRRCGAPRPEGRRSPPPRPRPGRMPPSP